MPDFAGSQVQMIDDRVKAAMVPVTRMGTVQSRDSTGAGAYVSLDGSSGTAQPVKCFRNVIVMPGDRVGLARFERDWVIVGNYTLRTLGEGHYAAAFPSSATTTSTVLVDMPNSPTATVTKAFDDTQLRVQLGFSARTNVVNTAIIGGVWIGAADGSGTPQDYEAFHRALNAAADHRDMYGSLETTGAWPAGVYYVTARWRIFSGSSPTLTVDTNDSVSIDVREVVS